MCLTVASLLLRYFTRSSLVMARHVKKDTLILVDPTEIRKEYAYKMKYVTRIRDASPACTRSDSLRRAAPCSTTTTSRSTPTARNATSRYPSARCREGRPVPVPAGLCGTARPRRRIAASPSDSQNTLPENHLTRINIGRSLIQPLKWINSGIEALLVRG